MSKKEIERLEATTMAESLYSLFLSHVEGDITISYKGEDVLVKKKKR